MRPEDYKKAEFLVKAHDEAVRKLKRQGYSPYVSSDWGALMKEEQEKFYKEADAKFGSFRKPSKEDEERWKKYKIK